MIFSWLRNKKRRRKAAEDLYRLREEVEGMPSSRLTEQEQMVWERQMRRLRRYGIGQPSDRLREQKEQKGMAKLASLMRAREKEKRERRLGPSSSRLPLGPNEARATKRESKRDMLLQRQQRTATHIDKTVGSTIQYREQEERRRRRFREEQEQQEGSSYRWFREEEEKSRRRREEKEEEESRRRREEEEESRRRREEEEEERRRREEEERRRREEEERRRQGW